MDDDMLRAALAGLPEWTLSDDGKRITRRFEFKGFARAVEAANLAAWLGNRQDHHPDICFGWGYCTVSFTSHDVDALSRRDLDSAARLDALMDGSWAEGLSAPGTRSIP
ncbi:4a-hydroxytetrahydrobiopterin dehydratase [Paracoccus sp. 1_MG-2023]|uniref:4a-hydroxytetrahydrobiopterin dehydratase n=1 Tax=unclassified Paracoccus (in: a-proteobacteria) TaxID=2688777 RepID=UPI001C09B3E5|nr:MULTISPECIES: 4a-hydroxytetrahydrobiopterin dehydratase [unclassified Paracoccus (in: a-proteobacteria)]MBU2956314.1 4a-hydroxytetrahydrobiopterin dehydratase [Paracoccus sp. C2R09]MDO6667990.1 4a-hydroxytetrahydrobiopterin dehydratase [Paracoccus sp. 1_MG-2023]